jgi:uncharacterized protein (TIGR03435 family)
MSLQAQRDFRQTRHAKPRPSAMLIMVTCLPHIWAQLPNQSDPSPAFEVASVRVARTGEFQEDREDIRSSPGSLTMRHVSLNSCIKWAYGLNDFQISGPAWLDSEKFDIVAKAAGPVKEDQLRLMLQALLAERFKLVLHRDKRKAEVYVLLVGKGGPKFRESKSEGASTMVPGRFGFAAQRTSTSQLAEYLAIPLRRPVLDLTRLPGRYDFALDLTGYAGRDTQPDDMASLMLIAVQEQLGLKLEARKGLVEILVIDHIVKTPTVN